jgi:hypothetical protein
MNEPTNRPNRPDPAAAFRRVRQDVDELVAVARCAAELFPARAPLSFGRLSDLLDELLPTDAAAEARVARALAMDPEALRRLRSRQLDPFHAPRLALATLANALRIERDTFRRLIAADHAQFAGAGATARGWAGISDDAAAWRALDAAFERVALDDPARAPRD